MSSNLLPEILTLILSNFENDSDSLLSCCLVSRAWCLSAISWLWKQPFHICPTQNRGLLVECCLELSYDKKRKQPTLEQPLFDYVSFLQHLNYYEIYDAVWYDCCGYRVDCEELSEEEKRSFMNQVYVDHDISDDEYDKNDNTYYEYNEEDDKTWSYDSRSDFYVRYYWDDRFEEMTQIIFHLFLSYSNKIVSLNLCTNEIEEQEGNAAMYGWIDQSRFKCDSLATIKKFVCDGLHNLQEIIDIMKDICHEIEILEINFDDYYYLTFSNLIKNQKNLKELKIIHADNNELNEIIDSLSYQAQNLKCLQFEDCIFENWTPFKEISLLHNLEELIFVDCSVKNIQDRSLDFSFPSLKRIQIDMKHLLPEEVESLISHSNLEEISLIKFDLCSSNIFNMIAINCSNIKFLDIVVGDHDFNSIIPIFIHCQQLELIKLQLGVYENITKKMKVLAKNIPESLNNLVIMIDCGFSNHDLMTFFSHFNGILKIFGFISNTIDSIDYIDNIIGKYAERKCVDYHVLGSNRCHYVEFF